VTVSIGFVADANNRCELLFDPAVSGDWRFEYVTGGTVHASTGTGVSPTDGTMQTLSVQREEGDASPKWSAHIDGTLEAEVARDATVIGGCRMRLRVETNAAAAKEWAIDRSKPMRLLAN